MGFIRFLFGLAIGVGAGYLAGRLYAPQPGRDFQEGLRARCQNVRDEAERAAEEKRRELDARYQTAKRSGSYRA